MFKQMMVLTGLAAGFLASPAMAVNNPPPAGNAIFNLDGQALPQGYTTYTVSFAASNSTTNLSFSFRDDPAYLSIDNISLTLAGGPNLVVNGDFEQGPVGSNTPTGFTYLNLYNANAAGRLQSECGTGGSNCYYDGAVGSYDSITQAIATTVGGLYMLSFDLSESSGRQYASALTTDTESGINLVVYAGALPTVAVPEPASVALLGTAFAGIAALRRRKRV